MPGSGLFRMDEFLLRGALWSGLAMAFVGLILVSVTAEGSTRVPGAVWAGYVLFAMAPIGMAISGRRIRQRERRALALLRLVEDEVELPVRDLVRDSDWTRPLLDRAVRDLNNSAAAHIVWDRSTDLIQDGRLRRTSIVIEDCASCGAKIRVEVSIGRAADASCPYCGAAVDSQLITEQKARVIEELETDRSASARRAAEVGESGFRLSICLLLFAVFWPFGLLYCFKHRESLVRLVR